MRSGSQRHPRPSDPDLRPPAPPRSADEGASADRGGTPPARRRDIDWPSDTSLILYAGVAGPVITGAGFLAVGWLGAAGLLVPVALIAVFVLCADPILARLPHPPTPHDEETNQ